MRRYWKIVTVVVIALLLAGIVLGGTGVLTGASPSRIVELLFGGWEGLIAAVESGLEGIAAATNGILPADMFAVTVMTVTG